MKIGSKLSCSELEKCIDEMQRIEKEMREMVIFGLEDGEGQMERGLVC